MAHLQFTESFRVDLEVAGHRGLTGLLSSSVHLGPSLHRVLVRLDGENCGAFLSLRSHLSAGQTSHPLSAGTEVRISLRPAGLQVFVRSHSYDLVSRIISLEVHLPLSTGLSWYYICPKMLCCDMLSDGWYRDHIQIIFRVWNL